MLDKHVFMVYMGSMKAKIVKVQRVRGQCLITIPKKMAKAGMFDVSEYAVVSQNERGDLFVRRMKAENGKEANV